MDIQKENQNLLIKYFKNGIKCECVENLGVEIEHFIVQAKNQESVSYYGAQGIAEILEELSPHYPKRFEKEGNLIGLYNEDYSISLEPAGQFEVSINPKARIEQIITIYEAFLELIGPILRRMNYQLITLGYQPKSKVQDLKLIPKKRYQYMDHYFETSGTGGIHMMRGTAATQVAIDYSSESDFVKKYRVAYTLMPLLALLTDNSPIYDGKPYEGRMLRSHIWDHVDEKRTGIIPGLFKPDFGFQDYAQYLMNLPLIFVPRGELAVYTGDSTTAQIWDNECITPADIDHIMSMTFLDVRLKNYIEIRFADSMPFPYVLGYLAFIKGIFYNERNLDDILTQCTPDESRILSAKESLIKDGFNGTAYDQNAASLLEDLFSRAEAQLDPQEQINLQPLKELINNKRTLAKDYYEEHIIAISGRN